MTRKGLAELLVDDYLLSSFGSGLGIKLACARRGFQRQLVGALAGRFFFEAGDFMFQAHSDDGVRVYIDGIRVIDAWSDGYKEPSNRFLQIGRGDHEIVIEFYERGGTAFNRVWWYRTDDGSGSEGNGDGAPHRNRDE